MSDQAKLLPGQAFAGQKLKFTGHLSDDRLLFAGFSSLGDNHGNIPLFRDFSGLAGKFLETGQLPSQGSC